MRKCPKCSLIHNDSVTKCTYCGYDFTEDEGIINETDNQPAPEPVAAPETVTVEEPTAVNPEVQNTPVEFPVENNANYNQYNAPQGKYCPRCGNLCDPKAVICVKCGLAFENFNPVVEEDKASTGLKLLCFFFPIAALILYLVYKDKKPLSAKEYGKWGIIGAVVDVAFSIFSSILNAVAGVGSSFVDEDYDYYYTIFNNFLMMLR